MYPSTCSSLTPTILTTWRALLGRPSASRSRISISWWAGDHNQIDVSHNGSLPKLGPKQYSSRPSLRERRRGAALNVNSRSSTRLLTYDQTELGCRLVSEGQSRE